MGRPDPYAPYPPAPGRRKRLIRWGVGITLASFLAGGGIALALSGGSNPAAAGSTASQVQGTTLNSELNTASTSSATSLPRLRWALARLRALGGVDGEFTFHNSTGFHTLAFERGTIQSVNSADLVVRAADGTTWTWLAAEPAAAGFEPPERARAIPPPARKPARVMPTPQRISRFLRPGAGGYGA